MSLLTELECPSCGASVPHAPGGATVCRFCGRHLVEKTSSAQPRSASPASASEAIPPRRMVAISVALLAPALALAGALAGRTALQAARPTSASASGSTSPSIPGIPLLPRPAHERLSWDHFSEPPLAVTVGGKDAVIGRLRITGDELVIAAVDAASVGIAWKSAPLGTYSEGYRYTRHVVVGEHVAVSDFRARLHVLALDSGVEIKMVALTDRVVELCALPGQHAAWARLLDEKSVRVDLVTGAVSEAKRPAECDAARREVAAQNPDKLLGGRAPRTPGVRVERVYVDGERAVLAGVKAPGTRVPVAVGVSMKTRAISWQLPLPTVDSATVRDDAEGPLGALVGGRYVGAYGVGSKGWHLASIDAETGARQWDVTLRPVFAVDSLGGLAIGRDHVFVARTSSIEVHRADTGAFVGLLGSDTWDDRP